MPRKLNEGYQLRCLCERGTSAAIARAKAVRFAKQKSRHCEERSNPYTIGGSEIVTLVPRPR